MFVDKKILIIGNGEAIIKTFYYLFRNNQVTNLSFREAWKNHLRVKFYDIIVLSGFHFDICKMKNEDLLKYIKKYYQFILKIKKNCTFFYLISTNINIKRSVSRVVYFYYFLNKKIFINNKSKIISFDTIVGFENTFFDYLKLKILKLLNIKVFFYKNMSKKFNNKITIYHNKKIKFYFINIPRFRMIDRFLRLIFDLFLFKIYK
jgi:hypothetical protein